MSSELENTYKEYIALLERSLDDSAVYLDVHGWKTPQEDVDLGEKLRAKIKSLTNIGE